jgi:membrane protein
VRQLPYLLRRTLFASFDDGLFTIAKGAAYSALLSLFPILATIATIFVQARADFVQQNVVSFLSTICHPVPKRLFCNSSGIAGRDRSRFW